MVEDDNDTGPVRNRALRRVQSTSTVDAFKEEGAKKRSKRPDKPIHRPRDSLFSWSSGFNDFEGFINWGFLLLIIGGSRLFLENVIKYGIRIDPWQWIQVVFTNENASSYNYVPPSIALLLYVNFHILLALLIEKGLVQHHISARNGLIFQVANLCVLIVTPIIIFNAWGTSTFSLFGSTNVCFTYSIVFLKLWSYTQVNNWCRREHNVKNSKRRRSGSNTVEENLRNSNDSASHLTSSPKDVEYPDNLNPKDLYYFMFAPTLCYELNFPLTERIRKRFLLRRVLEFVFGTQLVLALFQQWIIPTVKNSIIPFSNMDLIKIQERLLKLAIPNHLIWLVWFYLFFHCYLNILGELLKFADRQFYQDWWNAPDIDIFWRTWNTPVHCWAVRHLYIPIMKSTNSKLLATSVVFFISAFFHEYLVSVPLRTFKIWAFCGMMAQLPLSVLCKIIVGKNNERARWGNVIVWASLILGQPLCIMMYYHDYVITHFGQEWIQSFSKL